MEKLKECLCIKCKNSKCDFSECNLETEGCYKEDANCYDGYTDQCSDFAEE